MFDHPNTVSPVTHGRQTLVVPQQQASAVPCQAHAPGSNDGLGRAMIPDAGQLLAAMLACGDWPADTLHMLLVRHPCERPSVQVPIWGVVHLQPAGPDKRHIVVVVIPFR